MKGIAKEEGIHEIRTNSILVDDDPANGESYVTADHRNKDQPVEIIIHGRYLDVCERRDGVWRFYRRSLVLDWQEQRALEVTGANEADDGDERGQPSSEDPSHKRLDFFATQRLKANRS